MEIIILEDEAAVANLAADILARYAEAEANLGLATGSTPVPTYKELIRRHREEGLSFEHCNAFLLDEYVGLPHDHEQSYYSTIRREFTSHIDIHDSVVYSPNAQDPQHAYQYDRQIQEAGGIDVQLLGIGSDGHIGFNEPGSSLQSITRLKSLHPRTIADNARFFDSLDDVPKQCVTQGLGTISKARHLLLLATGLGKAQAVADMCEGPLSANCPASILQMHPRATVIIDERAGSLLQHSEYYKFSWENKPDWQDV
ncbi:MULTISPECIES: glucosamine-6-phosphate deaminase [unclassified Corynebacterium]|uniref:glucosamine-6-phosphate deaminase n=1 Tax=unclassified Corynebacterium TaxID=2624378 RepID=UPI00309FDA73